MSKCKYCGKEYDGGGLWDDGFCCGRCRSLAKDRKIIGKVPKGCLYIIFICVAFMAFYALLNPDAFKDNKKHTGSEKQKTELIEDNTNRKFSSQIEEAKQEQERTNSETSPDEESGQKKEEDNTDKSKEEVSSEGESNPPKSPQETPTTIEQESSE